MVVSLADRCRRITIEVERVTFINTSIHPHRLSTICINSEVIPTFLLAYAFTMHIPRSCSLLSSGPDSVKGIYHPAIKRQFCCGPKSDKEKRWLKQNPVLCYRINTTNASMRMYLSSRSSINNHRLISTSTLRLTLALLPLSTLTSLLLLLLLHNHMPMRPSRRPTPTSLRP